MHYYTEELSVYPQVETWDKPSGRRANNLSMPHPSNGSKKLHIFDILSRIASTWYQGWKQLIYHKDNCFNDYYIKDTKIKQMEGEQRYERFFKI
jgi:hypothetical protein